MKNFVIFSMLIFFILVLSSCVQTRATPNVMEPTITQSITATSTRIPATAAPTFTAQPTVFSTQNWSTTASTRTELSFAFPGNWVGSSPLTFCEGEFVKDPDQALGVTFQIDLHGSPDTLLDAWGKKQVGVIGITTFLPETVEDGPEVTIARVKCPTKIASGEGVTGQVAYIQRAEDVLEVLWFSPTGQWQSMQEIFNGVLENIELWKEYTNNSLGLHTMYVHDWKAPLYNAKQGSLTFSSTDDRTGLIIIPHNEIADPVTLLNAWETGSLHDLGLDECTLAEGDRMNTMSGQWESKSGQCKNVMGDEITYEISFVPNKDRLLEMILFSPSDTWEDNSAVTFKHLLGMMVDIRL